MYINKPSVTKIEAADRVNLLRSTSCSFERYRSSKLGQMLVSFLDMCHFMIITKKTLAFRQKKLNIK